MLARGSESAPGCPSENTLVEFAEGLLAEATADALEAHFDSCTRCAEALAGFAVGGPHVADGIIRGTSVGRYVVLCELGRGAMGVVYDAYDPELDRKVALKVLGPGQGHKRGRERLVREARVLARQAHDNIVTIYDAGTAGDRVFLAMERIDGGDLFAWLSRKPRSWRAVVDVFIQASRGLAAAHDRDVIHGDVKPENILVSLDDRVRLTDFGVARVPDALLQTHERPAVEGDGATQTGARGGTPAYMAPEQLGGMRADERTDQFGLCVSLFEALFGVRPFSARSIAALSEAMSHPVQFPAARTAPVRLRRVLSRGLRADPAQRFADVHALAAELVALRRRRGPVWVLVGAVAVAAFAVGRAGWSASDDACTDPLELDASARSEIRSRFLAAGRPYAQDTLDRLLPRLDDFAGEWTAAYETTCRAATHDPAQSACLERARAEFSSLVGIFRDVPGPTVVDKAIIAASELQAPARCDESGYQPVEDPALQPDLTLAEALYRVGEFDRGLELAESTLHRADASAQPGTRARARWVAALFHRLKDRFTVAERLLSEAAVLAAEARNDHLASLVQSSLVSLIGGRLAQAERGLSLLTFGEAALARAGAPPDLALRWYRAAGGVYESAGDCDAGLAYYERTLEVATHLYGPDHWRLADPLMLTVNCLDAQRRSEEGVERLQRGLDLVAAGLGPEHPKNGALHIALGQALSLEGRYPAAIEHLTRGLEIRTRAAGAEHSSTGHAHFALSGAHTDAGDGATGLGHARKALAVWRKAYPPTHLRVGLGLTQVANLESTAGDPVVAERLAAEAVELFERADLPADHPDKAAALRGLGRIRCASTDGRRGLEDLRRARSMFERLFGAAHRDVTLTRSEIGICLMLAGHGKQARQVLNEVLEFLPDPDWDLRLQLIDALERAGQLPEALALAREARAVLAARGRTRVVAQLDAFLAEASR